MTRAMHRRLLLAMGWFYLALGGVGACAWVVKRML